MQTNKLLCRNKFTFRTCTPAAWTGHQAAEFQPLMLCKMTLFYDEPTTRGHHATISSRHLTAPADFPARYNTAGYDNKAQVCSEAEGVSQLSLQYDTKTKKLTKTKQRRTSASVELTQTRHSHSKQLFYGGQISLFLQGGSKSFIRCL